jgi:ribonuclease R
MKKEIKAFFKNHPSVNIKSRELANKFDLYEEHSYAELKQVLFKLTEENYLEKQGKRYQLKKAIEEKLTGILQIVNSGDYGFVIIKDQSIKNIFIPGKKLGFAFNGDLVEVEPIKIQRGKNIEGEITGVVERKRKEIVGVLRRDKSGWFIKPDDDKIHRDIYIPETELNKAKIGEKVVVADIEWNSKQLTPIGGIKEVLGIAGSYDTEIASIAREFGLTYKFPPKVIKEAESIPDKIPTAEIKKRLDLRDKNIFTIDPADAKDFDDAVSVEKLPNGNLSVGIHIADVSHYVTEGTALYEEAFNRGTSVYIVGKVIPMLPERLSNEICSLVPGKDRLTYSVIVELTRRFSIVSYQIHKSVINSKRRFTYDEVQKIIETKEGDFSEDILQLNRISKSLREKRMKKGSINFFTPEVVFKLDKNGIPIDIQIKEIKESHNLIEELMLLANQIIAGHIKAGESKKNFPFVYRVHDLPDKEKVTEFARFVKSLGYHFDPNSANKAKQFQQVLEEVKGSEVEAVVNEVAVRSMAKAIYSTKNIGHYGLGFKNYTHFTSPIRRFPDLIVHSLIYKFCNEISWKGIEQEDLEEICEHSSAQERNAVNAERLSVKLKQIEYMKNKVGEEFHGVVSGVTHFGIFIELNQTLAEGLIRLRDLEDDYYVFDQNNYCITGKRMGKRIRLGDKVNIKLIRVNEEKRAIDFILI